MPDNSIVSHILMLKDNFNEHPPETELKQAQVIVLTHTFYATITIPQSFRLLIFFMNINLPSNGSRGKLDTDYNCL